jgi:uncharacterized protein YfiM (DUF2279 family)
MIRQADSRRIGAGAGHRASRLEGFFALLRLLALFILLAITGAIAGVVALPFAVFDSAPEVQTEIRLNPLQVARARALLAEHDPRRLQDGDVRALAFSADELALVMNYILAQLGGGASRVTVSNHALTTQLTVIAPHNPIGRFVNIDVALTETRSMPAVEHLRIGRLAVPGFLANPVLGAAFRVAYASTGLSDPGSLLHGIDFRDNGVTLHYQWHSAIADAVRNQFVPAADASRLRDFHVRLVELAQARRGAVTLPSLLAPLFDYAIERASGGDPVADNRAVLLVLSSYVSGHSLDALVPGAGDWPAAPRLSVRLHGRVDLAKHFVHSAALAATGGAAVAQTVGLFKELDDSRGGSGFSFIDLMADEAGTRFGKRATESRVMARALQPLAATALLDSEWMPEPTGLREHMSETEFNRRYGGVDGPGYRAVLADIERRIDTVAFYR